jgi:hypothetical protein
MRQKLEMTTDIDGIIRKDDLPDNILSIYIKTGYSLHPTIAIYSTAIGLFTAVQEDFFNSNFLETAKVKITKIEMELVEDEII